MPDNERQLALAPALLQRVEVRAADAAVGDSDLDVVGGEFLGFESGDLETGEAFRICIRRLSARVRAHMSCSLILADESITLELELVICHGQAGSMRER